jgi:predicted dehydrogenase
MTEPLGRVRIGIVGGGFMAKTHSLAYSAASMLEHETLPSIERVRVADLNYSAAEQAAKSFGWQEASDDWTTVTRADDIDLVDIVTPNNAHAEIAIDAARHGKHILCEKPLASSLAEAEEMNHAVEQAGVTTQVGFVFRKWPAMAAAKGLVEAGELGEILSFRGHYFHDYALDPDFAMGWRVDRAVAGAGSIGDLGSHVIDLARYLIGEVSAVNARSKTHLAERPAAGKMKSVEVDDATDCLLEFNSGAAGILSTNWMNAGSKTDIGFELSGTKGAIRFTWRRNDELQVYRHADPLDSRGFKTVFLGPMHPGAGRFWPVAGQSLGYGDAFTILIADLLAALGQGSAASPSFADGLQAARFVDAAVRSAEARTWVDLAGE